MAKRVLSFDHLPDRDREAVYSFFKDAALLQSLTGEQPRGLFEVAWMCTIFRKFFLEGGNRSLAVVVCKVLDLPAFILNYTEEPYDSDADLSCLDPLQVALAPKPPFRAQPMRICAFSFDRFFSQMLMIAYGRRITYREGIKHNADKHGVHFDPMSDDILPFFDDHRSKSTSDLIHAFDGQVVVHGSPVGVSNFNVYAVPLWHFIDFIVARLIRQGLLQVGQTYGRMGELHSLGPWQRV